MLAIASLLIVLMMSLLVTRVAAMALMLTGMSQEVARFQARSKNIAKWQNSRSLYGRVGEEVGRGEPPWQSASCS